MSVGAVGMVRATRAGGFEVAQQLDLIPDDVTIAKEAYARARKANNGLIHRQAARLYDAVHRDLWREFPKPDDKAAKHKPVAKPGYTVVVTHQRAISPRRRRQTALPLSVSA